MHYDVFNGDADGICALLQLRLAEPKQSTLITGVKRDIKLVLQVANAGDATSMTALDISMEKNTEALIELLDENVEVFYCDHHRSGDIPQSNTLTALIDLDSEVCTSLLINNHLGEKYPLWALVGAFGDNLLAIAQEMANQHNIAPQDIEFLKELGTLINYNGYGSSLNDLYIAPAELFKALLKYESPLQLRDNKESPYYILKAGYVQDYAHIKALQPIVDNQVSRVYELPCEAWARRMSGVFSNNIANQEPSKAHAVLTLNASQIDYTVSVRAPLENRVGADEICTQFATGGGRKAAAGINALPLDEKEKFTQTLNQFYS